MDGHKFATTSAQRSSPWQWRLLIFGLIVRSSSLESLSTNRSEHIMYSYGKGLWRYSFKDVKERHLHGPERESKRPCALVDNVIKKLECKCDGIGISASNT